MKKLIIIIFLLGSYLYSNEYKIRDINVNGLKKTRYNTVLGIIGLRNGDVVKEESTEDIRQKLLSAGIFQNDINVEIIPLNTDEADIKIDLIERWTIIPIPVVVVTTNSWLAGGVFIESNILGLNQTFVTGVFANNKNTSGFAAWSNPGFLNSGYSFGVSSSFYWGLKEHLNPYGKLLASHDQRILGLSANIGNSLFNVLDWNFSTGVEGFEATKSTGYLENQDFSSLFWKNTLSLSYDNLFLVNFFSRGFQGKIKINNFSGNGLVLNPLIEASLSQNFILFQRNLVKIGVNGGWQNSIDYKPIFLGGKEGSRAFPSGNVATKSYINALASAEILIFKPSWGMFTLPVYYEAGIYAPLYSEYETWHGPGVGFRFYVDKVALPALGADFTWDLQRGTFKVAVSFGGTGGGE